MNPFHPLRWMLLQRTVVWLLLAALLLPTLLGCASKPGRPPVLELAGIVVDGYRLAREGETGLVNVWRSGSRIEGVAGLPLRAGDRVETLGSATAVVRWPSGSEVYLRPNSSGTIGSVTQFVGELFAKIRGVFAVETQFVRAGVQGTQFLMRSSPTGATTVTVFDGRVEVSSMAGAWPSVLAQPGTTVTAHPRPATAAAADAAEVQRTRDWVERVERLMPPPRTSSSGSNRTALAIGAAALVVGALAVAGSRDRDRSEPAASETGRRGTATAGSTGTAGTAAPPPAPPAAPAVPALVAPGGTRPGAASERSAPLLTCARPTVLEWAAVPGATDYLVTLEARSGNGPWRPVGRFPSRTLQAQTAASLDGLHRWQVQARNAGGPGPASAWLYFRCQPYVLR